MLDSRGSEPGMDIVVNPGGSREMAERLRGVDEEEDLDSSSGT
jgi:hypothetical protein